MARIGDADDGVAVNVRANARSAWTPSSGDVDGLGQATTIAGELDDGGAPSVVRHEAEVDVRGGSQATTTRGETLGGESTYTPC